MSNHIFISNVRRFVRAPPQEVYRSLLQFLDEDLGAKHIKTDEEKLLIRIRLKGITKAFGFTARIRILREDGASTIELNFSYRSFLITAFILLISVIVLSIAYFSIIPFIGVILLFLLIFSLGSASSSLLSSINNFLVLFERDYDQRLLTESRRRWQADSKSADYLYKRLIGKHIKVWGDSHALEYKLSEYMRMGLTREEAIRKVAEDEGVS